MSSSTGVSQVVTFILQGAVSGAKIFTASLGYTLTLLTTMLASIGISGTAFTILMSMISSLLVIAAVVMLIKIFSGGRL